jgi:hypothetical protein
MLSALQRKELPGLDLCSPRSIGGASHTNNWLEGLLCEFGQSALSPAAARLRHVAGNTWSTSDICIWSCRRNMELLDDQHMKGAIAA